ncbi:MAG: AAA family ATPase [Deltaproteobacteria bacterium]|nr:AAA family ATPase [Deltaproteobacteria bacterium]
MYHKFFGFKENPFMLAPNPVYLFLGKSHEEALAHLIYAVSQGEGFISLIGKRGVGKTTICRTFIERRDENIEVAYIFKPELNPEKLLKKINSGFSIRADTDDIKELIDALNSFLMQKRVEGKKVVLFFDDAQNLKADVLEQVRLLSNLETTRDKLLQIVLVGEPGLADMLDSQALRQIGQRVSVSYYINPLTYEETRAYINHRMSIASQGTRVQFDTPALKRIYKFTGGIPRMINVVCDRSLLIAYTLKRSGVTQDIARTAILELSKRADFKRFGVLNRRRAGLIITGGCLLLFVAGIAYFLQRTDDIAAVAQKEVEPAPVRNQEPSKVVRAPMPASQTDDTAAVAQKEVEPAAVRNQEPSKAVRAPMPASQTVEIRGKRIPELQKEDKAPIKTPVILASNPNSEKILLPTVEMTHSVQVGAYRIKTNAKNILDLLKAKGYPGRIVTVSDYAGETWYTVRIGDYPTRETARQHAEAFSAKENMETAVRPYGKL